MSLLTRFSKKKTEIGVEVLCFVLRRAYPKKNMFAAQGSARHLEEEEQQSLALMQSIAEVKARLRTREGTYGNGSRTPRFPNREGRPSTASASRLQIQSTSSGGRNDARYKDPRHSPRGKKRDWA